MSFIAAVSIEDKFRLIDCPMPVMEAAMMHGFRSSPAPRAVTVVAKNERTRRAPKIEDILHLVKARLAPNKLDAEWFSGNAALVSRVFKNVLENPNANIVRWDRAKYENWQAQAEAEWDRQCVERSYKSLLEHRSTLITLINLKYQRSPA